jgi:hypothetical protein
MCPNCSRSHPRKMPTRLSPPVAGLLEGATTFGNRVRVDQWELPRAVTRSLYTELVHPVAKRVRMRPGFCRPLLFEVAESAVVNSGC